MYTIKNLETEIAALPGLTPEMVKGIVSHAKLFGGECYHEGTKAGFNFAHGDNLALFADTELSGKETALQTIS